MLFELGTEELPPRFLEELRASLLERTLAELGSEGLRFGEGALAHASSRRLAVRVLDVHAQTEGSVEVRKGPSVDRAFDAEGKPTPALLGFAKGCEVSQEQMERWAAGEDRLQTDRGEWLRFDLEIAPCSCQDLLPGVFQRAVEGLPLAKRMRWGAGESSFLRPVRWVVLMYGDEAVPGEIMGLACGVQSRGHRLLVKGPVRIPQADAYEATLRTEGGVLVEAEVRREQGLSQLKMLEKEFGVEAICPADRFDEVCAGAEFPVALAGRFDEEFLSLPEAVVRAVLEDQQQYFAARAPDGRLSCHFFVIANLPDSKGHIRHGSEQVVRSRLQDAAFYIERDQLKAFDSRVEELGRVVFHRKLGTQLERVVRIGRLAEGLACRIGADVGTVTRAAHLCKADLGTDMVQSFPKLQGLMGAHYAGLAGEAEAVCCALAEHYRPRQADDSLPESLSGQVLALADRLDMLAGVFLIGEVPTGARDPLGVRRAAYGVLRLIVECELDLDLGDSLESAIAGYPETLQNAEAADALLEYLADRMRGYGVERGQARDTLEAVLAVEVSRPLEVFRQSQALEAFRDRPQAKVLAATHKRIRNILREADVDDAPPSADLLAEPAERALAQCLDELREAVPESCAGGRYAEALDALAGLADPVETFFEDVLVMAEDAKIRHNRLRLLQGLHHLFLKIADFSRLQG